MNEADALFRAGSELVRWLQDRSLVPFDGPSHLNFLAAWPEADRELSLLATLRSCVEPRRSLCALATARNEGAYLVEWIAYHLEIGVEIFLIYSNNDDDGSNVLLQRLHEAGLVVYIENDGQGYSSQYKTYGHALKMLPNILDFQWALVINIDGYIVLQDSRDLRELLNDIKYKEADVISFNWHMFGTFGQQAARLGTPLAERFVYRCPDINPHTKCIFKPKYCEHSHAHYPFSSGVRSLRRVDANGNLSITWNGEPASSQTPVEGGAWINHYWTKSLDEMKLKLASNTGDQPLEQRRRPEGVRLKLDELLANEALQNPVEDRRIEVMLPRLKARMATILSLPGVSEAYHNVLWARKSRLSQRSAELKSF